MPAIIRARTITALAVIFAAGGIATVGMFATQTGEHPVLYISDSGADAGSPDAGFDSGVIPTAEVVALSSYGQSNGIGGGGATTILSTTQPFENLGWSNTAIVSLVEGNLGIASVEALSSGLCNAWTYTETGRRCLIDLSGVSGQGIDALDDGSAHWTSAQGEYDEAHEAFTSGYAGLTLRAGPLLWTQGEADNFAGTSESTYCNLLLDLQADWEEDTNAAWGGSPGFRIPIVLAQLGNWSSPSVGLAGASFEASTAIHQYNCWRAHPDVLTLSNATYPLPANADGIHASNFGHRRQGELYAKALRLWAAGGRWVPLSPDPASIACTGTTLTVDYVGGSDSSDLAIDTSSVTQHESYGASYWDPSLDNATDDMPVVIGASVTGRQLEVTLNRNCSATGRYRYAYYNVPRQLRGPTVSGAAGGNLRNSYSTRAYSEAIQQWDWAVASDDVIASCTGSCGTPSSVSTYPSGTTSLRTDSSPVGWVSCGNLAALNGSQHASVCFDVMHTAWPQSLTVIGGRRAGSRTQLEFRSTASAARALRVIVSANTNDTGTYWESAAATFTNSTWAHVCWTFDGTQADNGTRVHVFVNGSDVTDSGAFTGTIPSALTSPNPTDWAFGGDSEGGSNRSEWTLRNWAIWTDETLSSANVTTLYGPPRVDPLTASGVPDPEHHIPLVSNLEDRGVASTPLTCKRYGTGVTFPTTAP